MIGNVRDGGKSPPGAMDDLALVGSSNCRLKEFCLGIWQVCPAPGLRKKSTQSRQKRQLETADASAAKCRPEVLLNERLPEQKPVDVG